MRYIVYIGLFILTAWGTNEALNYYSQEKNTSSQIKKKQISKKKKRNKTNKKQSFKKQVQKRSKRKEFTKGLEKVARLKKKRKLKNDTHYKAAVYELGEGKEQFIYELYADIKRESLTANKAIEHFKNFRKFATKNPIKAFVQLKETSQMVRVNSHMEYQVYSFLSRITHVSSEIKEMYLENMTFNPPAAFYDEEDGFDDEKNYYTDKLHLIFDFYPEQDERKKVLKKLLKAQQSKKVKTYIEELMKGPQPSNDIEKN